MTLQHYQWFVVLTSVVFLTKITSAKMYPVSGAFSDDQVKRQPGYNVMESVSDSEDRALPSPNLIESMTNQFGTHVTEEDYLKKLTEWIKSMTVQFEMHVTKDKYKTMLTEWLNAAAKNTDDDAVPEFLEKFFVLWSEAHIEKILKSFKDLEGAEKASLTPKDIEKLEMLAEWKNEGMTEIVIALKMLGNDAEGEGMVRRWYDWTPLTPDEVTSHYEVLVPLEVKFGYKRLADYAMKKTRHPIVAQEKVTIQRFLRSRMHHDRPTADEFFKVLQLDKDLDPLSSPLLTLWSYSLSQYIGKKSEVFYKTMLAAYETDQALSRAIVSARGNQENYLLNSVQKELFEKLSRESLVEPFILEFEEDHSLKEESKKAFVAALKWYDLQRRHRRH